MCVFIYVRLFVSFVALSSVVSVAVLFLLALSAAFQMVILSVNVTRTLPSIP